MSSTSPEVAKQPEIAMMAMAMARRANADITLRHLFFHTVPFLGLQICWTILQVFGMTSLASLGISDRMLPILMASGPWSGLIVPPIIAAVSDGRNGWRSLIQSGGVGIAASLLSLASAESISKRDAALGQIVAGIAICTMNISTQPLSLALRASVVDNFSPEQQPLANIWISRFSALGSLLVILVAYASKASFPAIACVSTVVLAVVLLLNLLSVIPGSKATPQAREMPSCQRRDRLMLEDLSWKLPPLTRRVCRVQLPSWFSWFFILNYTSSLVAQMFGSYGPAINSTEISATALLFHLTAFAATVTSAVFWDKPRINDKEVISLSRTSTIPYPLWVLMTVWRICLVSLSIWLVGLVYTVSASEPSHQAATMLLSATGSIFGLTNWIPYALIGYELSSLGEDVRGQNTARMLAAHNMAICLPQIVASGVGWTLVTVVESLGYQFHVQIAFLICIPASSLAVYLV